MLFNRRTQAATCIVKTYGKTTTFQRNVGILCRRKQEERKSCNRNFKAAPAWIIRAGQMELGSRASLPGFKCWRAVVKSLCEKFSLIFIWFGVVALQRSDTSLEKKVKHFLRKHRNRCFELLHTINPSASCQVWQAKLWQPNLSRFPEETAETLCRGIHTPHPNTEYSCFNDRVEWPFICSFDDVTKVLVSRIYIK